MSENSKNIKNNLLIPEYPWSSDDEEDAPNPPFQPSSTGRNSALPTLSSPVPSTSQGPNVPGHLTESHGHERDIYWPCVNQNNGHGESSSRESRMPGAYSRSLEVNHHSMVNPSNVNRQAHNYSTRLLRRGNLSGEMIFDLQKSLRMPSNRIAKMFGRRGTHTALTMNSLFKPYNRSSYEEIHNRARLLRKFKFSDVGMNMYIRDKVLPPPMPMAPNQSNDQNSDDSSGEEVSQDRQQERSDHAPNESELNDLTVDSSGNMEPIAEEMMEDVLEQEEPEVININENANETIATVDEASKDLEIIEVIDEGDTNEQISRGKELNKNLLQLLECPVCLDIMEPPMCQCRRGHLVCENCRRRLNLCPVCRTSFSSVRNRAMEGVAEIVRYPCRHGCSREIQLRRRASHEANCDRRRYFCPIPNCNIQLQPHTILLKHCHSKHDVKNGRRHHFGVRVNVDQNNHCLVSAMGELFHVHVNVEVRTWSFRLYVAYVGPKRLASNYLYHVNVDSKDNVRKISYSRLTHSDLDKYAVISSRKDCFYLCLDQVIHCLRNKDGLCDPEALFKFSVAISRNNADDDDDNDSSGS